MRFHERMSRRNAMSRRESPRRAAAGGLVAAPIRAYHASVFIRIPQSALVRPPSRHVANPDFPGQLPVGKRHLGLPDRGLAARRRRRTEHLATLRAYTGDDEEWRHRRRPMLPL